MQHLTGQVWWVNEAVGAHCYLIDEPGRLILVDPGLSLGLNRVARALHDSGRSPRAVTHLLLTHYDGDHTQAAAEWQRRTGAGVWLGAADAAILTGAVAVPTPFRRLMAGVMGIAELPGGLHLIQGQNEILPGVQAIPTPGHTPGHVVFRYADVAFIGDSAMVTKHGELTGMPGFLNSDAVAAAGSLALVDSLDVTWRCAGHSAPRHRA